MSRHRRVPLLGRHCGKCPTPHRCVKFAADLTLYQDLINCLKDTVKIDVEKIRHQARAYCDEPPKKGNDKSGRTAAMHSDDEHHTPKSDQQHEAPSQPQRSSHHQQHSQEITQRIADADYLASTALFPVAPYPSLSQQGYAGNMMFEPYPGVSNEVRCPAFVEIFQAKSNKVLSMHNSRLFIFHSTAVSAGHMTLL